jgi:hypothetical protein
MKLTTLQRTMGGSALALTLLIGTGCGSDETTGPQKQDPVDEIAPLAPVGLVARRNQQGFSAGWQPNTEPDLFGYHVYVLGADPAAPDSWARVTEAPLQNRGFSWVDPSELLETYTIRVSAVDEVGNESVWSAAVVAEAFSVPKEEVEFGPDSGGGSGGGSGGQDDAGGSQQGGGEPVDIGR